MTTLRKLRDIPQVAQMERWAVLDPTWAAEGQGPNRREHLDEVSREVFGLTEEEAWDLGDVADWRAFDEVTDPRGVFEPLGWDVTDEYGRPLLMIDHFAPQLFAVIKGLGGRLPESDPDLWGAALEEQARQFARRREDKR